MPHREHTAVNFSEAIEPFFSLAVRLVLGYHALRVRKGVLGTGEGDPVLYLILGVLVRVPIKTSLSHGRRVSLAHTKSHTAIWIAPT